MNPLAIDARNLHKTFITKSGFIRRKTKTTVAVEDVSFSVQPGELFGLLGPNGAGKTTTVKMLATLLLPTRGCASILGLDLVKETHEVRKRIGFTFGGARGLYGRLSALDNLRYFAELYALEPEVTAKRIPELLETVGHTGREDDRVENYSSGMTQRLHLARCLMHDPELIYLDEPTVGIDPVGARELRATIKSLKASGKTILLTTHYMAEAEELCDRIAIIKEGRIVALDTPYALKQRISADTVIDVLVIPDHLPAVQEQLSRLDGRLKMEIIDQPPHKQITLRTPQPSEVMQLLSPLLNSANIYGFEVRNQTLEDVYVSIIQGEDQ